MQTATFALSADTPTGLRNRILELLAVDELNRLRDNNHHLRAEIDVAEERGAKAAQDSLAYFEAQNADLIERINAANKECSEVRSDRDSCLKQISGWKEQSQTFARSLKTSNERVMELEAALAPYLDKQADEPSQNKTIFNVSDMERAQQTGYQEGFNAGKTYAEPVLDPDAQSKVGQAYKNGHDDAKAETAQEVESYKRKLRVLDLLAHGGNVMIYVDAYNAGIPMTGCRYTSYGEVGKGCAVYGGNSPFGPEPGPETRGIYGYVKTTGGKAFICDFDRWEPLALPAPRA